MFIFPVADQIVQLSYLCVVLTSFFRSNSIFFTKSKTSSAFGRSAHLHLDLKAMIKEPRKCHERSSALLETSIRPHVVTARHLSSCIQQKQYKIPFELNREPWQIET